MILFFIPVLFARYFEAADKLNPALMRSLSSFFTFDLENSSFFLFIPLMTIVISPSISRP